jgi:pimeloyl-ACP methyl ester carboxylesterase
MDLQNGRVHLRLHSLRLEPGKTLLLLHQLGGSARDWNAAAIDWPGSIYALDLSGHGHSGRLFGGAYCPEVWAADADAALSKLGDAVVVGAGISAYVALLLAGARAAAISHAVLMPGAGLDGGGPEPLFDVHWRSRIELITYPLARGLQPEPCTDPAALVAGRSDLRPTDYAAAFSAAARRLILLEDGSPRTPWWQTAASSNQAESLAGDLNSALRLVLHAA